MFVDGQYCCLPTILIFLDIQYNVWMVSSDCSTKSSIDMSWDLKDRLHTSTLAGGWNAHISREHDCIQVLQIYHLRLGKMIWTFHWGHFILIQGFSVNGINCMGFSLTFVHSAPKCKQALLFFWGSSFCFQAIGITRKCGCNLLFQS